MMSNACGHSIKLALVAWIGIAKKLECKIGQASLLTCSDFGIFKGFGTCFNTLWLRFGLTLNAYPPLHCLKEKFRHIDNYLKEKCYTKEKFEEQH